MTQDKPNLLMIRPIEQSREFVEQLEELLRRKLQVQYMPVIKIEPLAFDEENWKEPLIFTSLNALRIFTKESQFRGTAICVGELVSKAALDNGFNVLQDYRRVADLVENVKLEQGHYIRGSEITLDIANILAKKSIKIKETRVYRQLVLKIRKDLEILENSIIPIFSTKTAKAFFETYPDGGPWNVVFLSEEIKNVMPKGLFRSEIISKTPTRKGMLKELEAIL